MCDSQVLLIVTPWNVKPTILLCSWDSPGKNARTGCYLLLQGIFLILRSNSCPLCLLHWHWEAPLKCIGEESVLK